MNADMQTEANKPNESDSKKASAELSNDKGIDLEQNTEESQGENDLIGRIEILDEELRETKDKFMRTLADMENMRRRHERERADLLKYASEKLLTDLMPILDSIDKAVASGQPSEQSPVIEGVKMVHKQLFQILENHGLKQVDAVGKEFDPNFHQAIQRIESEEVKYEVVKDEFQKGYTLNGRLIRPSMVSVCVPKSVISGE